MIRLVAPTTCRSNACLSVKTRNTQVATYHHTAGKALIVLKSRPVTRYDTYLGVGNDTHDLAVLLDALKLRFDLLGSVGELLRVTGEGLLL